MYWRASDSFSALALEASIELVVRIGAARTHGQNYVPLEVFADFVHPRAGLIAPRAKLATRSVRHRYLTTDIA